MTKRLKYRAKFDTHELDIITKALIAYQESITEEKWFDKVGKVLARCYIEEKV